MGRLIGVCLLLLGLLSGPAGAQGEDPPGRVGRLADLQGIVWVFDSQKGDWVAAERNRPLTGGDRLSTDPEARAELRIGSTVLRLAAGSELEVVQLDDQRMRFRLHFGSLALRVRSRELAAEVELLTPEGRVLPERAGHYRLDRRDDDSFAGAWVGDFRLEVGSAVVPVGTGQRVHFWLEGPGRIGRTSAETLPDDGFAAWVLRDDQRESRSVAQQYVSPEMTGVEDLDRYGRWDVHPDYGPLWIPTVVAAGWVPYQQGRWIWVAPWGWTWVDAAPWGFAPFHYGRWVMWGGRWAWAPGPYVPRPVYAPALVGWIGTPRGGVATGHGALPGGAWVPLAPRESYVPHYRASPGYRERLNTSAPPAVRLPPGAPFLHGDQPGVVVPAPVNPPPQDHGRGRPPGRELNQETGREPAPPAGRDERPAPPPKRPASPPAAPAPAPAPKAPPLQPGITIPGGGLPPALPPAAHPAPPPAEPARHERTPDGKAQIPESRPAPRQQSQ